MQNLDVEPSVATAKRLLAYAIDKGLIASIGKGKATAQDADVRVVQQGYNFE